MWEVELKQKNIHYGSSYFDSLYASFEDVRDAKAFITFALEGCENLIAKISYTEQNFEEEEDEK